MLTLKVSGMTCGGCVRSVTNAVKKAVPAAAVSVDLKAGEVTVTGTQARDRVAAAITEAGFEVAA